MHFLIFGFTDLPHCQGVIQDLLSQDLIIDGDYRIDPDHGYIASVLVLQEQNNILNCEVRLKDLNLTFQSFIEQKSAVS